MARKALLCVLFPLRTRFKGKTSLHYTTQGVVGQA